MQGKPFLSQFHFIFLISFSQFSRISREYFIDNVSNEINLEETNLYTGEAHSLRRQGNNVVLDEKIPHQQIAE